MSTDPREFEHPIDGTGGNVPPEAIEAAARAIGHAGWQYDDVDWLNGPELGGLSEASKDSLRNVATAALSAAYPFMEAQAKAEALREAADVVLGPSEYLMDAATCRMIAHDLRARAATIEGKSE